MKKTYITPETLQISVRLAAYLMEVSGNTRETGGNGPTGPVSDDDDDSDDESLGKWHRDWDFGEW